MAPKPAARRAATKKPAARSRAKVAASAPSPTRKHLYDRATALGITGHSRKSKDELAYAVKKAEQKAARKAAKAAAAPAAPAAKTTPKRSRANGASAPAQAAA